MVRLKFWGVRGSIPSPLSPEEIREKIKRVLKLMKEVKFETEEQMENFIDHLPRSIASTYGGNTPCVSALDIDSNIIIIFDMGSGIRILGYYLLEVFKGEEINIFLSHTHWDHIQGFPFFAPAYTGNYTIKIHGCHPNLEKRLISQQLFPFFPCPVHKMGSKIKFIQLKEGESIFIGNKFKITPCKLIHPEDSFGYVLEWENHKIVYATDTEFYGIDEEFLERISHLWNNADVLIFDAQYTPEEYIKKVSWGHSSTAMAVDVALRAKVKNLVLFHHDPTYSDTYIESMEKKAYEYKNAVAKNYNIKIVAAYEGLEFNF